MDFGTHGSANLNTQRSDLPPSTKLAKLDFGFRSNICPPDDHDDDIHNMLSFATPTAAAGIITFPNQDYLSSKRGLSSNNGGGGGGFVGRMKGPFTPSQWMELEHQALIYKHLVANVPVPSHLLAPLRTCGSPFPPNFLGWGPFHLYGSGGSTDPEPGRCRRTDGKKWRCSREAVPDQKYCERHINRGRHRSRKLVETNTSATTTAAASNVAPGTPSTTSGGGTTAMPRTSGISTNSPVISRSRGFQGLSLLPPQMTTTSTATTTTTGPKLKQNLTLLPFDELSTSEFGLISSDFSFLSPPERIPYINHPNSFLHFNENDPKHHNNVHQFINEMPKVQSSQCQSGPWPDELKSDWTQLSMSIPVATDFLSSSSSPAQEKSMMAIPRLTPMTLDLGVQKSSWLPVNWGKSMGGPLGEVLISSTTKGGENSNWCGSPQMGSSPNGVLQKSNLVSLSNSSSASSPEAEKVRLTKGILGAALAN